LPRPGLALWVDVSAKKVRLVSLRPVVPDANLYDDDLYNAGSLAVKEQLTNGYPWPGPHYGVADPTNKLDKESNFRAALATVGTETALDYDLPSITKTFSRWIPGTARNAAERLNDMLLARFQDGPRMLQMSFHPGIAQLPVMGRGIRVAASVFQDVTGAELAVPFFVTSVETSPTQVTVTAEEAQFFSGSVPGANRQIFIEADAFNITLRELYDSLYSGIPTAMVLSVYITSTAYVGSIENSSPSFWVKDDFPADTTIKLYINEGGGIAGFGGGGSGYQPGFDEGQAGGTALKVERPVEVINLGIIAGGGGGGGRVIGFGTDGGTFISAGGGGGSGFNSKELVDGVLTRLGGYGGAYGDTTSPPRTGAYQRGKAPLVTSGSYGGQGARASIPGGTVTAGNGGGPGQAGRTPHAPAGYGASVGGAAGPAVQGNSFITWTTSGDIFGALT
jgi:hypothetical protein